MARLDEEVKNAFAPFKWIRILWKCWQERTAYDETSYLKQLLHRKSPNAVTVP